jgi:hypothetical protein
MAIEPTNRTARTNANACSVAEASSDTGRRDGTRRAVISPPSIFMSVAASCKPRLLEARDHREARRDRLDRVEVDVVVSGSQGPIRMGD